MKSKILYFLIGGAIGFFSAKYLYQKRANEEIASVVEEFNKIKKNEKMQEGGDECLFGPRLNELNKAEAIRKNYSSAVIEKNQSTSDEIEQITDSEFDTFEDDRDVPYTTTTLYCFEDGVIADRENDVVKNIKELIGTDIIHFDRYDALYFRNHRLKIDIEILRDERYFSEIKKHEQYYEED